MNRFSDRQAKTFPLQHISDRRKGVSEVASLARLSLAKSLPSIHHFSPEETTPQIITGQTMDKTIFSYIPSRYHTNENEHLYPRNSAEFMQQ